MKKVIIGVTLFVVLIIAACKVADNEETSKDIQTNEVQ